jgi:nickel-type superoxide dismutase maturation protease
VLSSWRRDGGKGGNGGGGRGGRLTATAIAFAAGALGAWLAGRGVERIEVSGPSMSPALADGDRLLLWRSHSRLRPGDLVALRDPHDSGRLLVKRVASLGSTGLVVHGDNPDWSRDSRSFGTVPRASIIGRPVYRYHPPARAGRLRRAIPGPMSR